MNAMLRLGAFVGGTLSFFVWAGFTVTEISGEGAATASGDTSAEAGRALFFGKGKCSTCHSLGDEGSAIRCPNLGAGGSQDAPIGVRAAHRVPGKDALSYIVESIYEPSAFVTKGYPRGLMKPIDRPPIALSDGEIASVVLFLMEASGTPLDDPSAVLAAQRPFAGRAAGPAPPPPGIELPPGDASSGRDVFLAMDCTRCHALLGVEARPGTDVGGVGPDLTGIGAVQTRAYLAESLLDPDAVIVANPEGVRPGGEGSYQDEGGYSRMPSFLDTMTVQQLLDLSAFLAAETGAPPEEQP